MIIIFHGDYFKSREVALFFSSNVRKRLDYRVSDVYLKKYIFQQNNMAKF